ncbi:deoxynucleoside kinase [Lactiplantibacillus mudanjiangensis]|uniref:Deoxyguanosine kinase [Lactobacillus plantarum JDM1] n=1 Tax=Lactiplantibacillus mudanjiangensis TaxID=1296538 RepID=A0A660E8Q1_9LACO|nr:deoxynucleoside kinase [Lactiplantibacillus mudanjiangensis]VDG17708.1 deoxyguanosine kinase [Lactobacillus plantarum JDM1] [Lactiplantibacillus mudanjiangensis]VDG24930.1 deoxyguanosine kinase [Lactobacillus plantarum JDM1] [Lactiplantibacillus mudanjiangensis]VDG29487.1 deoxyguanosine kinase [Lactobacillus plantarum JDM1] [Lactiplantibacillus mudanjiangensis]VDG32602.1 deoxyguanosine kinase [Lactobacillus plantarum JDM1] [Lactiplantibacillus mudanjiangensis]
MLVMSGTIGAGKTSLTHLVAEHFGSQAFYESVDDNPILPLFYKDPKKYAFLLQIYFLNKRLDSIKSTFGNDLDVLDRSIFEDSLLFHLNGDLGRATSTEVDIYDSLLTNMMQELPEAEHQKSPDLLIHINISFDTMLQRIQKRGRSFEQIDQDPALYKYYQTLNDRYTDWYANYDHSPKMQIDGDELDFVADPAARATVIQMIDEKVKSLG